MPTISLCMIVKNEEKNLPGCLRSVKNLVDEVIIVDTGSTDKTIEVAQSFGAKVFEIKWPNDFAKARNAALTKASGDWILTLDADERIAPQDVEKIQKALEKIPETVSAFSMIQRNYTNDHTVANWTSSQNDEYKIVIADGFVPNAAVRLYKKGIKWKGVVHETVTESAREQGDIAHLKVPIHHLGHLNQDLLALKRQGYELLLRKKAETGDPYAYYELGRDLLINGKLNEAEEFIIKSIHNNPHFFKGHFTYGNILMEKKQTEKAIQAYEKAIELNPNSDAAHLAFGKALIQQKLYTQAGERLLKAVFANPKNASAHFHLAMCFTELGDMPKANLALENAIKLNPKYRHMVEVKK